jgi:hypothetical protein
MLAAANTSHEERNGSHWRGARIQADRYARASDASYQHREAPVEILVVALGIRRSDDCGV